jgi:hypothetical protein
MNDKQDKLAEAVIRNHQAFFPSHMLKGTRFW